MARGKYQDEGIGVFVSHTDGSKPTKEEIATAQREAREKFHLMWDSAVPMGVQLISTALA